MSNLKHMPQIWVRNKTYNKEVETTPRGSKWIYNPQCIFNDMKMSRFQQQSITLTYLQSRIHIILMEGTASEV